jgi:hypothetical protein
MEFFLSAKGCLRQTSSPPALPPTGDETDSPGTALAA